MHCPTSFALFQRVPSTAKYVDASLYTLNAGLMWLAGPRTFATFDDECVLLESRSFADGTAGK